MKNIKCKSFNSELKMKGIVRKILHLIDVALMDSFLDISQRAGVKWRMRNKGVHPGQADS
jgi:hypothetical protein